MFISGRLGEKEQAESGVKRVSGGERRKRE